MSPTLTLRVPSIDFYRGKIVHIKQWNIWRVYEVMRKETTDICWLSCMLWTVFPWNPVGRDAGHKIQWKRNLSSTLLDNCSRQCCLVFNDGVTSPPSPSGCRRSPHELRHSYLLLKWLLIRRPGYSAVQDISQTSSLPLRWTHHLYGLTKNKE